MSERNADLITYARRWQSRLGLDDWEIAIHLHEGERVHPDVNADCPLGCLAETLPATRSAELHVGCARHDEEVRETIRHELVHVVMAEMQRVIQSAAAQLGPIADELLKDRWRDAEELAVQRVTTALEE